MSSGPAKRFWLLATLRGRLFVWNTFTILLLTITMLIGLREGVSYTVLREEDETLREDADEIQLLVQRSPMPSWDDVQEALNRDAQGHAPRQWFCQILDAAGHVRVQSEPLPALPELPGDTHVGPRTFERFRVTQQQFTHHGDTLTIRLGSSLDGVRADVNRITRIMLLAGGLLLVLAPLGGYLLANRAIRPISQIIETTANLRPSRLTERLPLQHTNDELDQLSQTINGLLDRIADYLAHHRDLMANAAHELRSPLAAMRSTSEVALHRDRTPEEYKEFLGHVIDECDRLGMIVQHLLLLAESDANRLERQASPVDLRAIVQRSCEMFEGVAEARGVLLQTDLDAVTVHGDAGYLRQVVLNLLDNAIKFAPGGRVKLTLRREASQAVFRVVDTGRGIAAVEVPKVFERFYRTEKSRARSEGSGSGLGLSICQALVTAHGGTIEISSTLGEGTTVTVRLPL